MFYLLIKGLIIGFIVSAPIGPIGILCAQRTLSKGPAHGVATALGASISDLLYALVAVFSMSFVVDFIHEHELLLRITACAVIFFYGLYTYINNPVRKLRKMKQSNDFWQDCLSSFGLTITNPLVILLFIALFAKFSFPSDTEVDTMTDVLAITYIMLGATLWWGTLISFVSRFRDRFNIRGMWILNRITGIILMIISVAVIIFWLVHPYIKNLL